MLFIIMGSCAFFLFFLYDINSIKLKLRAFHSCFFIGFLLLIIATAGILISTRDRIEVSIVRMVIFGLPTLLFLWLLIYTLFFALPFKDTYVDKDSTSNVYQNGVYALCRHPGVIMFIGFYLFFGLTFNIDLLYKAAIIFSSFNIFYVIFQDNWTFIKQFDNYNQYKMNTPFLIPNIKSIKRCLETL